jgi:hypothetical protein
MANAVCARTQQQPPAPPTKAALNSPMADQTDPTIQFFSNLLGQQFRLEILVREAGGNQTAVESCFAVE